jgi:hypothetical protein
MLKVQTLTGNELHIGNLSDRAELIDIKTLLYCKYGILAQYIRLFKNNILLADNCSTLKSYNIVDGDILRMTISLWG